MVCILEDNTFAHFYHWKNWDDIVIVLQFVAMHTQS